MKEGLMDIALTRIDTRMNRALDKMTAQVKGEKKFQQEPIPPEEQLRQYEQLTLQDIVAMVNQHGPDVVTAYDNDMQELRRQRYG